VSAPMTTRGDPVTILMSLLLVTASRPRHQPEQDRASVTSSAYRDMAERDVDRASFQVRSS
jgi:hypothetical protein